VPYVLFVVMTAVSLPLRSHPVAGFVAFAVIYAVGAALGLGYSVRAATHPRLEPALRRPWRYLAGVFGLDVVIGVAAIPIGQGANPTEIRMSPLLLVGVVAVLVQSGLLVTGLLSFASLPWEGQARRKLAMDVIIVVGAASMILWYVLIGPAATGRGSPLSPAATLYDCACVLGDLASVVGISAVLLRGTLPSVRLPVRLVLTSVVGFLVWDVWTIWDQLRWRADGSAMTAQLAVTLPLFLMVAAAVEQCRAAGREPPAEPATPAVRMPSTLPYLALMVGFGVQLTATVRNGGLAWFGLVIGGGVMTFGVAMRQFIALRENHALALTDSLTGLANRDRLRATLDRAVADSRRVGTLVAVLVIDLNGFKLVNDTYGHDTGDELLVAFADLLRGALRTTDTPARWGGDEFVVILTDFLDVQDAISMAERILGAANHPVTVKGRSISIQASIGIAVTGGPQPATPEELLHGADQAMYRIKRQAQPTTHPGWMLYRQEWPDADTDTSGQVGSRHSAAQGTVPPPRAPHAQLGRG
jgi:diguanylate cyclase (GGDEF)-like protein